MLVTLVYHIVDRRIDAHIAVSEKAFAAQLAHIRSEGYSVLTLTDVLRFVSGEGKAPERGLFITFDDGYDDNLYAALPRLQEHGLEATLFVPTAYVGQSNAWNTGATYVKRHLDWRELELWVEGGGRIGGHTHDHVSAAEAGRAELRASIELNRRLLGERLGIEAEAFAYPYGVATLEARAEVARLYEVAWVVGGGTWDPRHDRFRLNRFEVDTRLSLRDFARGLEAVFAANPATRQRGGNSSFHVLGIGPLTWESGYEHVLDALRLLADRGIESEYRIVGSGDYEDALAFACHQLGLDWVVELIPPGGTAELLEHLWWADVVVHAAVVPTSPAWLGEAQAAGRPIVTTELSAGGDATGLVVPRRDAAALADALAWTSSARRRG